MDQISNRLRNFYDNVQTFWGGIICSICSPLSKNYFIFKEGLTLVRMRPLACRKKFVWFNFSVYLSRVFNETIFPIVQYIKCIKNKMESPDHSLYFIEGLDYVEKREVIRICYTSKQFEDSKCSHLCNIKFNEFFIPMKFIANYKQALKSNSIISSRFLRSTKQ